MPRLEIPRVIRVWRVLAVLLLGSTSFEALPVATVHGDEASSPMNIGRTLYREGRFHEAVDSLLPAVQTGTLSRADRVSCLEYLWRSQFRLGDLSAASTSIFLLKDTDSTWHPNADRVPPDELAFFDQASASWHPVPLPSVPVPVDLSTPSTIRRPSRRRLYYSIGAGVVGVTAAALALGHHKRSDATPVPFGSPPDPPGN